MEQCAIKNVSNYLNTNICPNLETSGCRSSNLNFNDVPFSTPVLIIHMWQFNTVVFLHWCLICTVLFYSNVKSVNWCHKNYNFVCAVLYLLILDGKLTSSRDTSSPTEHRYKTPLKLNILYHSGAFFFFWIHQELQIILK